MKQEEYRALYEVNGNVLTLDAMQLLDPPPGNRRSMLLDLLRGSDDWVAFQAALILVAWGELAGVEYFERILTNWSDRQGYFPHRIDGYENACDEIAYAGHLFRLSGSNPQQAKSLFRALLSLYGPVMFESRLKYALLRLDDRLETELVDAIKRALQHNRPYLASQLLPVLARWRRDEAFDLIMSFMNQEDDPSPRINVAEALRFLSPRIAAPVLHQLIDDADRVVSGEARASLDLLGKHL